MIGDLLKGTHSRISGLGRQARLPLATVWPFGDHVGERGKPVPWIREKRIAYSCGRGNTPEDWEVCVVDVATGAHRVLTRPSSNPDTTSGVESPASLSHASWSTNGRDIALDGTHQVTCPSAGS